ncbi:hypothetical protein ATN84_16360 [Paramesorhizobium deserti]|uniref:Uncharacterized protein n=1 Tax=Paramesorhizobium deserti TaxID=1494590 RepID=A0A135HQU3_9HYPH|nr:hypothetical protein ATN84_16360 [Paramesorhizobium deserti]
MRNGPLQQSQLTRSRVRTRFAKTTLFAIAAEGIAAIGSRSRELTQEEYDWANGRVFQGALPPRDQIVLTNTIGGGGRAFAFPRFDRQITLNM